MKSKNLIPAAGAWLVTVAGAYYLGQSQTSQPTAAIENNAAQNTRSSGSASALASVDSYSSPSRLNGKVSDFSTLSKGGSNRSGQVLSIAEINQLSNPLERSRQLLLLIDSLSPGDFAATLASFDASNLSGRRFNEYSMLLSAWTKADPAAAIQYAQTSKNAEDSTKQVLASWASSNTDAALAWARANHTGDGANQWLTGIIQGIASSNPTKATEILKELPYSAERGQALQSIIPHIAKLSQSEINSWLSGLQDEQLYNGAVNALASTLSEQDPSAASQWVSTLTDTEQRKTAVARVISSWTKQNPVEALVWLETLPAQEQAVAEPGFISTYASSDPNAAADWLDARAGSENYQELLQNFALGSTNSDPVLALNYGNEIEDERSRARTVGRALWRLNSQDKEAAQNWIQNNEVPERVKRFTDRMQRNQ